MNPGLKYPSFNAQIRQEKGKPFIFDSFRKKWLVLTPEEWVRQHVLHFLVNEKKYPASVIAVEKEIELNGQKKRFDIVVYNKDIQPALIIECKAPYIELDQNVIDQAQRYNLILSADYLMITNGVSDYIFSEQTRQSDLPSYTEF